MLCFSEHLQSCLWKASQCHHSKYSSTDTFSFKIAQLRLGAHGPCAPLCPGQLGVLMQMNVVGWSVNIAVRSDGERMQAACTALLIYPPPRLLARAPCKLSCRFIAPDKRVCDLRQSHQPALKAGRSPTCIVWGQLGFFSDKPLPLAAVQRTLLLNHNHNPLCSRRCYPHRKH